MEGDGFLARSCIGVGRHLNEAEYMKPLPWVGLYVAAASIFLGLLLFLDFSSVVRNRKSMFTRGWFQLNAATLTILAIATKLPTDLNTPMPDKFDQLSKLSGNILICTIVGNFALSLGDVDSSNLFSNIVALIIFVVTVIVNICIQMRTGVIYVFWFEHIVVMSFTLFLLSLLALWALVLPAIRRVLQDDFKSKYNTLIKDYENIITVGDEAYNELEQLMKRYWLLALTHCSWLSWGPLSFMGLVFSSSSLFIVTTLTVALSTSEMNSSRFCTGGSDYGWSTQLVFYSQAATIFLDCLYKFLYYISIPTNMWFNSSEDDNKLIYRMAADYWTKKINHLEDQFVLSGNTSSCWRNILYVLKRLFFRLSRASSFPWSPFKKFVLPLYAAHSLLMVAACISFRDKFHPEKRNIPNYLYFISLPAPFVLRLRKTTQLLRITPSTRSRDNDLEDFMETDEGARMLLVTDIITIYNRKMDVEKWIEKGKKQKPTKLKELMQKTQERQRGFGCIARIFDSSVPSLVEDGEPKNCWAMPIVTLFSIAMNIPDVSEENKMSLLEAVRQGLKYVRFIEHHLDSKRLTYNARKEVQILWKQIELKNKWYDEDLQPQVQNANAYQKLEYLAMKGQEQFKREIKRNYVQWSGKAIAWYNMYKIAKTIQIQYYGDSMQNIIIFDWIRNAISYTLIACLSNLPRAIYVQCISNNDNLDIEENIRNAALILGETREVMTSEHVLLSIFLSLQDEMQNNLGDDRRPYIDEWIKEVVRLGGIE